MPLGHPADHVNIAKAPGTLLEVRFQVVGSVVVALMAGLLLGPFRLEEGGAGPDLERTGGGLHVVE